MPSARPQNYRTNPFHLFGRDLTIAGMAGPHNNGNRDEVFDFLKNKDRREVLIGLHEKEDFTDEANQHGIEYLRIPIIDFAMTPIPASIYDGIFAAVKKATEDNKLVAIHCGSGDGRTATAMAALKLRELLEKEARAHPEILDSQPENTVMVKPSTEDTTTPCTPLVKAAIESIRSERVAPDISGIHAVEKDNDIVTLIEYEKHLRQVLKAELNLTNEKEKMALRDKVAQARNLFKKMELFEENVGEYNESLKEMVSNLERFLETNPIKEEILFHIKRIDEAIAPLQEELRMYLKTKSSTTEHFLADHLKKEVAYAQKLKVDTSDERSRAHNDSIDTLQRELHDFLKTKPSFDALRQYSKQLNDVIEQHIDRRKQINTMREQPNPDMHSDNPSEKNFQEEAGKPTQSVKEQLTGIKNSATPGVNPNQNEGEITIHIPG